MPVTCLFLSFCKSGSVAKDRMVAAFVIRRIHQELSFNTIDGDIAVFVR